MKRIVSVVLLLVITVTLIGCSNKTNKPKFLDKEGIAPYKLSDSEKYVLQSFGMDGNSGIISFNAPKEAITLDVNIYRLDNNEKWDNIGGGAISIGIDRKPAKQLAGTFTIQLKENYAIDYSINSNGRASYKTDEISLNTDVVSSAKGFLQEFQEIEINKEIPVAIMIYDSGTSMRSYCLQDYFEPSKFDGMDLVQVVTLTFSDKEL